MTGHVHVDLQHLLRACCDALCCLPYCWDTERGYAVCTFRECRAKATHYQKLMLCCCGRYVFSPPHHAVLQALHARALALKHPLDHREMKFVAPVHADFESALHVLGLTMPDVL